MNLEWPYRISYKKLKDRLVAVLLIVSTLSFSWSPIVFIIPVVLLLSLLRIFYMKFSINYILIVVIVGLIIKSLPTQVVYIEWVRNILIACLIPLCYFSFYNITFYRYIKILKAVYISSIIVVAFIIIIDVPKDLNLFFGDRRGFYAREYLFFGREFPFSLGVTHLNIYINYIFTFLFISLINGYERKKNIALIILFTCIAIATASRSPILYLIIMILFFRSYISKIRKGNILRKVKISFFIILGIFSIVLSYNYIIAFLSSSERIVDASRFIFFAKGFEHMLAEPWGNSLLYTDSSMPLLNYHNTFLAFGNRIGLWFFVILILSFVLNIYYTLKINNTKLKYTFLVLLYFCFHNYMIEDVIKFDYFVLIIHFSILPFLISNKIYLNEKEER